MLSPPDVQAGLALEAGEPLNSTLGVMKSNERCSKWGVIPDVDYPCADISFSYNKSGQIILTMHFSSVTGLPERDIELSFNGVVSLRWESETFGFNPLPDELPKCTATEWQSWTFPMLKVDSSSWLQAHEDNALTEGTHSHFALVTMNDSLQIIAKSEVKARWVLPQ